MIKLPAVAMKLIDDLVNVNTLLLILNTCYQNCKLDKRY